MMMMIMIMMMMMIMIMIMIMIIDRVDRVDRLDRLDRVGTPDPPKSSILGSFWTPPGPTRKVPFVKPLLMGPDYLPFLTVPARGCQKGGPKSTILGGPGSRPDRVDRVDRVDRLDR